MDSKILADLRTILTQLYPDEATIRRLMADAGIDSAQVDLGSTALNDWHAVLAEALKNNRMERLLSVVEVDYGGNQSFVAACAAYRQATGEHDAKPRESDVSDLAPKEADRREKRLAAEGGQPQHLSQGALPMKHAQHINLPKLRQALFDAAKWWQSAATWCGAVILLINIVVVVTNQFSAILAAVAILLTIIHVFFLWRADQLRGEAEETLRRLEFYDGLGWAISRREIANLLASVPKAVKQAAYSTELCEYWASTRHESPRKLLENLEESAWWSKHLARHMVRYAGGAGVVTIGVVLITLLLVLQSPTAQPVADLIAQVIILVVLFMLSSGYIRLAFDYDQFARAAEKVETQSVQLQENSEISEIEAVKLLHDYQIDRSASPLLPSWLWRAVKDELNELWKQREASGS